MVISARLSRVFLVRCFKRIIRERGPFSNFFLHKRQVLKQNEKRVIPTVRQNIFWLTVGITLFSFCFKTCRFLGILHPGITVFLGFPLKGNAILVPFWGGQKLLLGVQTQLSGGPGGLGNHKIARSARMPKGGDLIEFNGIQSNLIRIALNPLNLMNLIRFRLFAAPGRKHQRNQWFNRGFWRSILVRGWEKR